MGEQNKPKSILTLAEIQEDPAKCGVRPRALMKERRDQCLSSGLWKCSQHRASASDLRLAPNRIVCEKDHRIVDRSLS